MRRSFVLLCAPPFTLVAMSLAQPAAPVAAATVSSHPRIGAVDSIQNFGWASSNWSGYALRGGGGAFQAVTGHWNVPSAGATSKATYSSTWIGIDGFNNSSLIQTGTESDYFSGAAHYYAWWEILPAAETPIRSIVVHPGDHMSARVARASGSSWSINIADSSTGASFSTTQTYAGPQSSAEWIQEAPTVNGHIATLAHYTRVTFDPGTVNGGNPHLGFAESGIMVQKGLQVSTPSAPDSDTDGFNCVHGSTQPSPPKS